MSLCFIDGDLTVVALECVLKVSYQVAPASDLSWR